MAITHGEDVLLQRAPPTTGVCSRSALHSHSHSTIHACEFASARRLIVQYLCMTGTLHAMHDHRRADISTLEKALHRYLRYRQDIRDSVLDSHSHSMCMRTPPQHELRVRRERPARGAHTVSKPGNEARNLPARTKDGPYTHPLPL